MKYLKYSATGAVLKENDARADELVKKGTHEFISKMEFYKVESRRDEVFTMSAVLIKKSTTIVETVRLPSELHEALRKRFSRECVPSVQEGIALLAKLYAEGARIYPPKHVTNCAEYIKDHT